MSLRSSLDSAPHPPPPTRDDPTRTDVTLRHHYVPISSLLNLRDLPNSLHYVCTTLCPRRAVKLAIVI